jgi:hypothetical protein
LVKAKRKRHWSDKLRKMGACSDAVKWAKGYRSATAAWKACENGGYLEWVLRRLNLPIPEWQCHCEWDSHPDKVQRCIANYLKAIRAQYPTPPKKKAGAL